MLKALEYLLPACVSFGPLFMIMVARGDMDGRGPLTRKVNYIGLGMLVAALIWLNLTLVRQRGAANLLEQRVSYLEKRIEESRQPCPGVTP